MRRLIRFLKSKAEDEGLEQLRRNSIYSDYVLLRNSGFTVKAQEILYQWGAQPKETI